MNNTIVLVLIFVLVAAVAGVAGYKLITKGNGETNTVPGGDQRTFIFVDNGRIRPNPLELTSQRTNLLVINNTTGERHELVIAKLSVVNQKTVEEALRTIPLEPSETVNVRIRLTAGDYVIYCDIKKGEHEHRKDGEELRFTVSTNR